jgi:hypothetical protein
MRLRLAGWHCLPGRRLDPKTRVGLRAAQVRLVGIVLAVLCIGTSVAGQTMESDVKAAFLYNFSKFVEWPTVDASGAQGPFRICVVANAEFTQALDRIIEGESVQGRRLARVEPQSADEARGCNILYIGHSERDRASRLLTGVRQAPVLTVSDVPRFVEQGGAIGFVLDHNRVRFDISTRATNQAGLKVSSKLLRIARTVTEDRQP